MKRLLLLISVVGLVSCKTTYDAITYVELRGDKLHRDKLEIDSRYTHSIESIRKVAGLKGDTWRIDKIEVYDKDSHLKNNEKQGRYPLK